MLYEMKDDDLASHLRIVGADLNPEELKYVRKRGFLPNGERVAASRSPLGYVLVAVLIAIALVFAWLR